MEHAHHHQMESEGNSVTFTTEALDTDQRSEDLALHGMDMMKMYFHGGYNEVILFDFWRISTLGGLIGSMIGCFILGILYEGLKFLREFLIGRELRTTSYTNVSSNPVDISDEGADTASVHSTEQAITRSAERRAGEDRVKIIQTSILSRGHLLQTLLQFVQIVLSYCLMLIFMTYNVWLCLAVALGAAAGYFMFGWKKTVVVDVGGEHCH